MSARHPPDTRPATRTVLSSQRVTRDLPRPYAPPVPSQWPAEEFREYLLALMREKRIANYAELSRLSGVSQWQFSQWNRGLAQPSAKSLRKVAPVVGVQPVNLFIAAGLNEADELELDQGPDLRVGPREFVELAELWDDPRLTDEQRSFVRRSVATLVAGLRAELPVQGRPAKDRPSGGRRTA